MSLIERLASRIIRRPWDHYMVLYSHDGKEVWCRKRRNNPCPLRIATVDPKIEHADYTHKAILRMENGWDLVVVGIELNKEEESKDAED